MGDAHVPGGAFYLGAVRGRDKIIFDCEKWEHRIELKPFRISKCCVTNAQFAAFVAAGGYDREELWSFEGRRWLREGRAPPSNCTTGVCVASAAPRRAPTRWQKSKDGSGDGWMLQWFDELIPLPPHQPVSHVNYYEAEAYCAWAHRRLPTEAEWEVACCGVPEGDISTARLAPHKGRSLAWGDAPVSGARTNAGLRRTVLLDADALPDGDSAWGVRQMIGNVWEWTATTFYPYPGYVMDYPYREQSAPHFGVNKVARGGCFATPDLVLRGDYRSFYHPTERKELCVGFRTCAL